MNIIKKLFPNYKSRKQLIKLVDTLESSLDTYRRSYEVQLQNNLRIGSKFEVVPIQVMVNLPSYIPKEEVKRIISYDFVGCIKDHLEIKEIPMDSSMCPYDDNGYLIKVYEGEIHLAVKKE